jgi:two-component system, OmpR family, phosphate regulon sensor histidine kinase PhoR
MRKRSSPGLLVGLGALAVALAGLVAVEAVHRRQARHALEDRLRLAVGVLAQYAPALFALPSEPADAEIRRWAAASGLRITLIASDGGVHADSWTLPGLLPRLENHLQRPEVVAARRGEVGVARRRSVTTDRPTTYVARLVGPIEHPPGFLRLAQEDAPRTWPWGSMLVALLVALAAGWLAERWATRYHGAAARHLEPWTDLPPDAELEAIAEEADRRFRATREELTREVDVTREALERVAEGVVLLDREGVVRFANVPAARLLGEGLAAGHPLVEAVRVPEVLAAVQETLARGGIRHTSVALPGGMELAVRVCALEHPVLAVGVVLRDVREERQLERARRALVADLAHELRTPLTVLSGLAEELGEAGTHGELASTLTRQVAKLRVFAEELEELARIEAGQLRLHLEEVDAAAIARQVLADLRDSAEGAGVTLMAEGVPAPLRTDQVRLAQVLSNLVDNGIRYNRRGGHVTVRTAPSEGGVRIEVEDDGVGIPAVEIGLVFQRFYRVRRRAESEGGSGLGLAIVKHLVRALGGTVSLTSREGEGTVVTLVFSGSSPPASGE